MSHKLLPWDFKVNVSSYINDIPTCTFLWHYIAHYWRTCSIKIVNDPRVKLFINQAHQAQQYWVTDGCPELSSVLLHETNVISVMYDGSLLVLHVSTRTKILCCLPNLTASCSDEIKGRTYLSWIDGLQPHVLGELVQPVTASSQRWNTSLVYVVMLCTELHSANSQNFRWNTIPFLSVYAVCVCVGGRHKLRLATVQGCLLWKAIWLNISWSCVFVFVCRLGFISWGLEP